MPNDLVTLIGAVGFPIVFVFAVMRFVDKQAWPQAVKWYEASVKASAQRHNDFIAAVSKNAASEEVTGKMLLIISQKLDEYRNDSNTNHAQVMIALQEIKPAIERIDRNTNTGFGVNRK